MTSKTFRRESFETITIIISHKKRKSKCTDKECEEISRGGDFGATQGFKLQDILKDHGNAGIPPQLAAYSKGAGLKGKEGKLDTLILVCCAFFFSS